MKNHFNAKSLTFYGVAIAVVVALFSITTNYGEANLKAQPKISGRYKLIGSDLPECLKAKTLVLSIEQSGIYLNGSLLESTHSTREETASRKRPSLTGLFRQPNLELSGTAAQIQGCENSAIVIESAIAQNTLNGKLSLNNTAVNFVAQHEDAQGKE